LIRVSIVAPSLAVRAGLRSLLADELFEIVGESASLGIDETGEEPDVVIWFPASSAAAELLQPEIERLGTGLTAALLLIHDDPKIIGKLAQIRLRAWGLLPQEATQAEINAAVRALNEGLVVANPLWIQSLSPGRVPEGEDNNHMVEPLTGREMEILQLLALGLTNKQIASRLGVSAHTVKFHVSSIFGKMGTNNRTETVKLGLRKGLILL
jgi:two-component system, NarL family, response regulator YdfI